MTTTCADCKKESSKTIDLACKNHLICSECYFTRGKASKDLACSECSGERKGIWIFADDSNIWIEAMKLKGKQKGFKTKTDPRLRIDVGKLADQIAADHPVAKGVLFGSEPPPVDTVWENIREKKNWEVRTPHRNAITNKEKQVDTMLVAEVTERAIKTPKHERTTIVLVTGDADVIPAVDQVLKEEGWKIEIYMWRQSMSHDFYKYKDRVDIKPLDNLNFTFTNMKFKLNRLNQVIVKENGVVLTMKPNAFEKNVPTENWCEKLENIAQWPVQHYWFKVEDKRTDDLVIVFLKFESEKPDLKVFLEQAREHLDNVKEAKTFLEHSQGIDVESIELEKIGVYSQEDLEETDDWSNVEGRRKKKKQKYSDQCTYEFNCLYGTGCRKKHTEKEKEHFRTRNDGRGNSLRKVKCCTHFQKGSCNKPMKECEFAHGEADAWCLQCCSSGHYTDNCPKK